MIRRALDNSRSRVWIVGASFLALAAGAASAVPGIGAGVLIVAVSAAAIVVATQRPTLAISISVVIGMTAGFTRRLLAFLYPESNLIFAVVLLPALLTVATCVFHIISKTDGRQRLPPFWAITIIAITLSGINPSGAGVLVNLLTSSLLGSAVAGFVLAFRGIVRIRPVMAAAFVAGTANCLYMLWQVRFGLTPWDALWVATDGYPALYLGPDLVRPLGLASSAAESSAIAGIVIALGLGYLRLFSSAARFWALLPVAIGVAAVLESGTRTFLLLTILALVVALVARSRHPLRNMIVVSVVTIPVVVFVASRFLSSSTGGASRTLTTLSGQEDLSTSTIPIHINLLVQSFGAGLRSVIGQGSGRLGVLGDNSANAEIDLGNMVVMAGVVGLIAICAIYVFFFRKLPQALRAGGVSTQALLVLVATFGQWMQVGFYGVTGFVWLMLGAYAASVASSGDETIANKHDESNRVDAAQRQALGRGPTKDLANV